MKIKQIGYRSTTLNRFDLLGSDETGLAKSFAYLLSINKSCLYVFLKEIGINVKKTENNYKNTLISIEEKRNEGRTDIEIKQKNKFHLIVECKVGKNKIGKQRTQYLPCFDDTCGKNVLCFITQEHDFKRELNKDVDVFYRGWIDVLNLFDSSSIRQNEVTQEFIGYVAKGFKMRDQKEVLIQDLSEESEITRYSDYSIYRRNITFGSPLYFSPYFTNNARHSFGESTSGIWTISKVLGILTIAGKDISSFTDELNSYANEDENMVKKWIDGIGLRSIWPLDKIATYYFLSNPLVLNKPLMKDANNSIGWIARTIPRNRCVTFEEFMRRMIMANTTDFEHCRLSGQQEG